MKTTIDIADALMEQTKRAAASQGTTVRALVELGLRKVLSERKKDTKFVYRPVVFRGDGPADGVDFSNWAQIRDQIYEGRGT